MSEVFAGRCFCLTGKLSRSRHDLEELIYSHGGLTAKTLTKEVTYLITNASEYEKDTEKHQKAIEQGVPILDEGFLQASVDARKLADPEEFRLDKSQEKGKRKAQSSKGESKKPRQEPEEEEGEGKKGEKGKGKKEDLKQAIPRKYVHIGAKPIVERLTGELKQGQLTTSRYGGLPYMEPGEKWPMCKSCKSTPLRLMCQIDLAQAPDKARGSLVSSGLLQYFVCAESSCEGNIHEPYGDGYLVRIVDIKDKGKAEPPKAPKGHEAFEISLITGWEEFDDYPHSDDFDKHLEEITADRLDELDELKVDGDGDKLGGWPAWVQGAEYPDCEECGAPMKYAAQFAGEHVDHMYGDAGNVQLMVCGKHRHVMTMVGACG